MPTVEQYLIEKGIKQGLERGIKQGLEEARKILCDLLELKYGKESLNLMDKIEKIKNLDELRLVREKIKSSDKLEELEAFLSEIFKE